MFIVVAFSVSLGVFWFAVFCLASFQLLLFSPSILLLLLLLVVVVGVVVVVCVCVSVCVLSLIHI